MTQTVHRNSTPEIQVLFALRIPHSRPVAFHQHRRCPRPFIRRHDVLSVARPHLRRLNLGFFLQTPMLIRKTLSANPRLLGSPAEKSLGLLPTHTRIRNRNAILQTLGALRWNILPALH